jgi:hypothetical protein
LNKDYISHLNRAIISNETEAVLRSPSTKKNSGPDGFAAQFYQSFKEELTPMLFKLFRKTYDPVHPADMSDKGTQKDSKAPFQYHNTSHRFEPKLFPFYSISWWYQGHGLKWKEKVS